jgi:hypothetical protein
MKWVIDLQQAASVVKFLWLGAEAISHLSLCQEALHQLPALLAQAALTSNRAAGAGR